ncbi:GLPGLI family protein [Zobellia galactanivorans]|uniref:GLPGLI family protein n=1 Tax=Zobellia galactanivorans (strain DSM 12802 / CCUG 47099 / CIP 106680 / NCIMB 13871 / Dsij) TaxID=63186 RepID=UPI0026E132FC|nr:GLPGLI family protein [Zobellia galactanivorans]MDO6810780.1 GLPGLI family protein [Zobellia galactanivorans]
MKTTKSLIFILFFFALQTFYSQEGEIVYKSIFFDMPNVKKDKDFKMKVSREINDMEYLLRYNKETSFFEGLPHVPHDKFMAKIATGVAHSNFKWYQNPKTNEALHNKKILDSLYIVSYDDRMKGWELHNETKKIDGYTCYKATMDYVQYYTEIKFTIEAWYTPEIPVPYGPAGYGGLPGLILQLQRSHVIFVAKEIRLNPKGGIKPIKDLKPGRLISEDEKRTLQIRARKVTEN